MSFPVTKATAPPSTSSVSRPTVLARFIAALSSRCASWSFPWSKATAGPAHLELGRRGERLAAAWLRRNGYRVLYRNYRSPRGGEIDLVCRDKKEKTLVFVEVKTRRSTAFGEPGEAVNLEKQKLIVRGALAWLRLLNDEDHKIPIRFDIVEIVFKGEEPHIHVIKNAFQMPERYMV